MSAWEAVAYGIGYGSTGPYANAPGYDVVIEAEAGLMHITGEKGGAPVKVSYVNNAPWLDDHS